jgi:hypothetical protein
MVPRVPARSILPSGDHPVFVTLHIELHQDLWFKQHRYSGEGIVEEFLPHGHRTPASSVRVYPVTEACRHEEGRRRCMIEVEVHDDFLRNIA